MELRAGYKNTEIGVIPEDWECSKIGDITNAHAGGTPSTQNSSYWNGNIRWMNSGELNLKYVSEVENRITEVGLNNSSTKLIPKFCILVGLAGQGKTRGTVAINSIELCTNQSIAAIYPSKIYESKYLYFYLDSQYLELRKISTGDGGRGGLNLRIIKNIRIPLPKLSEQKAISEVLSDTDELIHAFEKRISKKRNIKQGAMQKLLTPKEGWETKKLGDFGNTFGGLSGKSKSDFVDGEFPYIPFMNIMTNPIIDETYFDYVNIKSGDHQNTARKGDLFFNGSSETPKEVGMCSVLNKDIPNLYLNSFCFGFRFFKNIEVHSLYLVYFLRSGEGRNLVSSLAQGSTRINISKKQLLKLSFKIPKIEEQKRIATILSDMDKELKKLEDKLDKYKDIKQGLMQQLLTGKIRLV